MSQNNNHFTDLNGYNAAPPPPPPQNQAYGGYPPHPGQQHQPQPTWHGGPPAANTNNGAPPPPPASYDPATKPSPQQQGPHNNQHGQYYPPTGAAPPPQQYGQQPYLYHPQPYQPQQQQMFSGRPAGTNAFGYPPAAQFQHELLGCFEDCDACLEGWLCGYCQVASQYNKIEKNVADVDWLVCGAMGGLDYCCGFSGMALCIGTMIIRGKIRSRYNINPGGSECEDCCAACCCTCCSIIQQHREMKTRGQWPGGICGSCPPPPPRQEVSMGTPVVQGSVVYQTKY